MATGGFGRGWLFPYSDIDLLFLYADRGGEELHKDAIRQFSQELWDLKLKLSPASRTLAECDRFDPNNTEFTISLLDCRYPGGRSRVVCAASRQINSQAGDARVEAVAARTGGSNAGAAWKVRAYGISSRAESERDAGRTAGLQRGLLAGADFFHGPTGRMAGRRACYGLQCESSWMRRWSS